MKKKSTSFTYLYLFSIILILLFIYYFFFHNSHVEHYKGLSKVSEFEEFLKKKYTKVDTENKVVTKCSTMTTVNSDGEEKSENNCKSLTYKYHFNKEDAVILVKDKIKTSSLLQSNQIPVPKFFAFSFDTKKDNIDTLQDFKKLMSKHNIYYPIVIKQIHGTFGIDVYTHIDNDKLCETTLQLFRDKGYNEVMCEEQIEGHCYRVFVFNRRIMDIIKREAPYVTGDGVNSIRSLIDMRNKKQLEKGLFETKNISEPFIQKNGYTLDTILPKGKSVVISTVINMHNGANISRIPIEDVPEENKKIFIKTNDVIGIMTSGIDFLSNDIKVPYSENNGRILEVNGTPDTEIHTIVSSQNGDKLNIYEKIANHVFDEYS